MAVSVNKRIIRSDHQPALSMKQLKKRAVPMIIRMVCFAGLWWLGFLWMFPLIMLALWTRRKPLVFSGSDEHPVHSIALLTNRFTPPYWLPGPLQSVYEFIPHIGEVTPFRVEDISVKNNRVCLLWFANDSASYQEKEDVLPVVVIGHEEATYKLSTIVKDIRKSFSRCVVILPQGLSWCTKHNRLYDCESQCFPFLGDTRILQECLRHVSPASPHLLVVSVWSCSSVVVKLAADLVEPLSSLNVLGCVCVSTPISPGQHLKSLGVIKSLPLSSSWITVLRKNYQTFAGKDVAALSSALRSWRAEDIAVSSIPFAEVRESGSLYFSGWDCGRFASSVQVPVLFLLSSSDVGRDTRTLQQWKRLVESNPNLAVAVLPAGGQGCFRHGLVTARPVVGEIARAFAMEAVHEYPTLGQDASRPLKANRSLKHELDIASTDGEVRFSVNGHSYYSEPPFNHFASSDKGSDGSDGSQESSPVSDKEEALPPAKEDVNLASVSARSPVAHSASPSKVSPTVRMSSPVISEDKRPHPPIIDTDMIRPPDFDAVEQPVITFQVEHGASQDTAFGESAERLMEAPVVVTSQTAAAAAPTDNLPADTQIQSDDDNSSLPEHSRDVAPQEARLTGQTAAKKRKKRKKKKSDAPPADI